MKELKRAHERTTERYNKGRFVSELKIGDKVLVRNHSLSKKQEGIAAKLKNRWKGPFVITRLTGVNVTVRISQNKVQTYHVDQVKMFKEQ